MMRLDDNINVDSVAIVPEQPKHCLGLTVNNKLTEDDDGCNALTMRQQDDTTHDHHHKTNDDDGG